MCDIKMMVCVYERVDCGAMMELVMQKESFLCEIDKEWVSCKIELIILR